MRQRPSSPHDLGLEPVTDAALKEVDVGSWSGLTRSEVEALFPAGFARWLEYGHGWDDGETYDELGERVVTGLLDIDARHSGTAVLAVTHGGPIRSALAAAEGVPFDVGAALDPRHRQLRRRPARGAGRETRASRLTASWRTTRTSATFVWPCGFAAQSERRDHTETTPGRRKVG